MDERMQRAVADSHYLMAFLARAQLVIEGDEDRRRFDEYATAIATMQRAHAEGSPVTAAEQAAFWRAFIFLSNLGSPATIESIRYYFEYYGERRPAASGGRTRRRSHYSGFILCVLVVTLLLSLVGFIGSRTLDQYAADSRHWYGLVNIARLASYGQPLAATFDRDGRTLLIGTTGRAPMPSPRPEAVPSTQTVLAQTRGDDGEVRPVNFTAIVAVPHDRVLRLRAALPGLLDTTIKLEERVWHPACVGTGPCVKKAHVLLTEEFVYTLAALHVERRILETLLWPVSAMDRWIRPPPETPQPRPPTLPSGCAIADPFAGLIAPGSAPRDPTQQVATAATLPAAPADPEQRRRALREEEERREAMMQDPILLNRIFLFILCNELPMPINLPPPLNRMMTMGFKADLALNVLNTYVLTLLFGMLGAGVHVMRDINRRLDDFTMTRGILNRYWARVILGGISGAFIGLFFNAQGELGLVTAPGAPSATLTTNLTGVALAFVAGFSVEVLFALLDRVTQIFREFAYGADAARGTPQGAGPPVRRVRVQ